MSVSNFPITSHETPSCAHQVALGKALPRVDSHCPVSEPAPLCRPAYPGPTGQTLVPPPVLHRDPTCPSAVLPRGPRHSQAPVIPGPLSLRGPPSLPITPRSPSLLGPCHSQAPITPCHSRFPVTPRSVSLPGLRHSWVPVDPGPSSLPGLCHSWAPINPLHSWVPITPGLLPALPHISLQETLRISELISWLLHSRAASRMTPSHMWLTPAASLTELSLRRPRGAVRLASGW